MNGWVNDLAYCDIGSSGGVDDISYVGFHTSCYKVLANKGWQLDALSMQ